MRSTLKNAPRIVFASCRDEVLGSIHFGDKLTWSDPLGSLLGEDVLIIVHGTANTNAELVRLAEEIALRNSASYDVFVMFCWPGGASGLAYLATKFLSVGRASKFLREVIAKVCFAGADHVDIDAHSLGVPIALEALHNSLHRIDAAFLKAGACGRSLAKYRVDKEELSTEFHVFYSPKDLIVSVLYRVWFGFSGALGAYGEKTPGGNIGIQYDVSPEIEGSHVDYRRCSMTVQAMRDLATRRGRK